MGILIFLFSCMVFCSDILCIPSVVDVSGGKLKGDWSKQDGVTRFLGVPYASPPVGSLRFAEPESVASWSGEYDSTTIKPACPQDLNMLNDSRVGYLKNWNISFELPTTSEDCLYLNIYVPGEVQQKTSLPVMVHFQDGGFQVGLNNVHDGSFISKVGNVIVVTFSARLGALGFYGNHNLGLWDQINMLKWVQNNIAHFGGDPGRVTLFGSGSGGFSVGLHVLSAESRGLFQRAISQGATALDTSFVNMQPDAVTNAFNKDVGCEYSDKNQQMKCLRGLSVETVLAAQAQSAVQYLNFMPTIDGKILPASPYQMMMTYQFNDVDYMIGMNSNGGTASVYDFFHRLETGANKDYFNSYLGTAAYIAFPSNPEAVRAALFYEYTPSETNVDAMGWFKAILEFSRDAYMAQTRGSQLMHSASLKVFAYLYDQSPPIVSGGASADLVGVPAGVEDLYLFGHVQSDFSKRLVETWTSFAKTGNPYVYIADGSQVHWSQFNMTNKNIAILRSDTTKTTTILDSLPSDMEKRVTLWVDVLPKLTKDSGECKPTTTPNGQHEEPIVKVKQGHVMGRKRITNDNHFQYEEYLDIPFAAPPVGNLRFRPPQPHQGWSGVLNRTRELTGVKMCPQSNWSVMPFEVMDEDCLTLDIYVPYGVSHVRYRKLPVMFWIFGGGYFVGSKNFYPGTGLIQRDVIYVAPNYRLGALGFLATGDAASRGNYGLMDQHLALKWVKENIGHFGGDPDEITIFGESAGAGSVMLQVVAPVNNGLFKRAIAQSGSIFSPWSLKTQDFAHLEANKFAKGLNCSSSSTFMMVNCLRKVDPMTLAGALSSANPLIPISMNPVVDGVFIPKSPEELYSDGVAQNITLMMGRTTHEGYSDAVNVSYAGMLVDTFKSGFTASAAAAIDYYYKDTIEAVTDNPAWDLKTALMFVDMFTDNLFASSIEKEANLFSSNGGHMYRFLFNFHSAFSVMLKGTTPLYVKGQHGDDISYVFGFPCVDIPLDVGIPRGFKWPADDVTLCHAMMDLWTNFAHSSNPVKGHRDFAVNWPRYTPDSPYIFNINENMTTSTGDDQLLTPEGNPELFRPRRMAFWNNLIPKLTEYEASKPCNGSTTSPP